MRSNIYETSEAYLIEMEVPGVKKEDIKISTLNSNTLVIEVSGDKRDRDVLEWFCRGFLDDHNGRFVFDIPSDVDKDAISAKEELGILVVTLKKKEDSKKIIEVE